MKVKLTEQQFRRVILKEQTDVEIDTPDAILVFGGSIKKGQLPQNAKYRVEKAVELYNQELAPNMLMTGYKSISDNKTPKETEAQLMKDYAIELGVDENDIFLEEQAQDTIANIIYSKLIMDEYGWKNMIFVSSDFHMERIKLISDYIFDDTYNIDFVGAKSIDENVDEDKKSEDFLNWFGDTENDNESLLNFLDERHPVDYELPQIPLTK
jgi:vancomycin permeability regulator SanA